MAPGHYGGPRKPPRMLSPTNVWRRIVPCERVRRKGSGKLGVYYYPQINFPASMDQSDVCFHLAIFKGYVDAWTRFFLKGFQNSPAGASIMPRTMLHKHAFLNNQIRKPSNCSFHSMKSSPSRYLSCLRFVYAAKVKERRSLHWTRVGWRRIAQKRQRPSR